MLQFLSMTSAEDRSLLDDGDEDNGIVTRIVIAETSVHHSGVYRCEPAQAPSAQVVVHVLDGMFMASYLLDCSTVAYSVDATYDSLVP